MKILHLSDLHLGRSLNDTPLLDDQRHALEQARTVVESRTVDVVAITGDVYDRAIPPVEAQLLLEEFVYDLVERLHAAVVVIPGNHDSAERIGFARRLLAPSRVHIASPGRTVEPVVLHDAHGPVTFYPVPYIAPADFRDHLEDRGPQSFTDVYEALFEPLEDVPSRSVCLAHCFAANGVATGDLDEKPLWIGGVQVTEPRVFDRFALTLLGHLHRPQQVGPRIFYAGSLLPYSFADEAGAKAFAVYDLHADGSFSREEIPVVPLRRVRRVRGELEALLALHRDSPPCPDLLEITITDVRPPLDYRDRLKRVYPNAMVRQWVAPAPDGTAAALDPAARRMRTEAQVVTDFYAAVGVDLDDGDRALLADVLDELLRAEREA